MMFALDSPLVRFLNRFADLMILNLLFLVTALPIVTLGAALTALSGTAMRLARGESESVTGDYLRALRRDLRPGMLLGLVVAGLGLVLAAWWTVIGGLAVPGLVRILLYAVCGVLAFRLTVVALFAFPYLATFDDGLRTVLRNARLMSVRHAFASLALLMVTGLPVVVTVFYPQVVVFGLLWFLFGFAGVAYLAGIVLTGVFATYAPKLALS
ncbi:putative membrane protein YesL [Actinoplanes tereljensis]|nr:YesL family protein [Actinoplanes tereljensis]